MSQYAHLSTLDPEFAALLTQLPSGPPPPTNIAAYRDLSAKFTVKAAPHSEAQLRVNDRKVPVQGAEITVRTYVPQATEGAKYPLLVWAHGGGWCLGGLDIDDTMLQKLAVDLKLSAVSVAYRLAPEHKFPTGLNDTYEALKWASAHTEELSVDLTKGFIIGGASSGGQFMATLAHRARDDPLFLGNITGQMLQVPSLVHVRGYPEKYKGELLSLEQNKDAPVLGKKALEMFTETHGATNPADPDVSPLLFPSHKNLPPAYIQVAGLDPLRDEGILYAKLLKEEGVVTKLDIYPGVPHGFHLTFPSLEQTVKWNNDFMRAVEWLLKDST